MSQSQNSSPSFEAWVGSRLRALYEAETVGSQRGTPLWCVKSAALLSSYMVDYEKQPFASSMHESNLGSDGQPRLTDDGLRKRAELYLRDNIIEPLTKLAQFDGVEAEPFRVRSAEELWAETHEEHIVRLVCSELGIAVDTPPAFRPDDFHSTMKNVIRRAFTLLPSDDQQQWRSLANTRPRSDRQPTTVQNKQATFSGDLKRRLRKALGGSALGETFVVVYQGFYVGEVDRQLHTFSGQVASYDDCPDWRKTDDYVGEVSPMWSKFAESQAYGYTVPSLGPLPLGSGPALMQHRILLKEYFESLWDFAVAGDLPIDANEFWTNVSKHAEHYIPRFRFIHGTRFADPLLMSDDEFICLYASVRQGQQSDFRRVSPESHMVFNPIALDEAVIVNRARMLKEEQEKRRARVVGIATGEELAPGTALDEAATAVTTGGYEPGFRSSEVDGQTGQVRPVLPTAPAAHPSSPDTSGTRTASPTPPVDDVHRVCTPSRPIPATLHRGPVRSATTSQRPVPTSILSQPSPSGSKRRRRNSIPPATEDEMSAMGNSLGERGYNTRHRENRRPVDKNRNVRQKMAVPK